MGYIDKNEIGHRQQMILMSVLHNGGKATVPELIDLVEKLYEPGKRLTIQGMNTSIAELMKKKILVRNGKRRQCHIYEATMTLEEFRAREMKRIINLTFNGDNRSFARTMAENMNEEELEEFLQLLREKKA